jgi:hypothetical protein
LTNLHAQIKTVAFDPSKDLVQTFRHRSVRWSVPLIIVKVKESIIPVYSPLLNVVRDPIEVKLYFECWIVDGNSYNIGGIIIPLIA